MKGERGWGGEGEGGGIGVSKAVPPFNHARFVFVHHPAQRTGKRAIMTALGDVIPVF
jgi:hypothetical protein